MRKQILLAVWVLCLMPLLGSAQVTDATLKLNVSDTQNNSVAGSSIEIINEETGVRRAAATDNHGQVTVAGLTSGNYSLTLKAAGFKTFQQRNLKLNVGQTAELAIQLSVGEVHEVVNIEAGAAQLQISTEGRVADALDQRKVSELPIPQRDVYALPKLSVGATFIPGAANSTKLTNSPVVTVNGNRYRGNNYVLDGAMNSNSNNSGEPAIVPSIEAIEEVQVQTNNFSSEFGRGNGAVGGGYYDRPNALADGAVKSSFDKQDFLNGLFPASIFPAPSPVTSGNLGRNTFRGPKFSAVDLSFARIFTVLENKQIQFRVEAFNAFNQVNLYLPNADLSPGV